MRGFGLEYSFTDVYHGKWSIDYRLWPFWPEYSFNSICHRPWSMVYRPPALCFKILRGLKMVATVVFSSAAANMICQLVVGFSVDVSYKCTGAVITVGAMIAG